MAVLTSTAILIAAGVAAGTAAYTTYETDRRSASARDDVRKNNLAAKKEADDKAMTEKASALTKRKQRLADVQRNDTSFKGSQFQNRSGQARKTLTGE